MPVGHSAPPADPRPLMSSPLRSPTCDELLVTTAMPYWRIPMLAGNARARSGDLLSHGSRPRHGARAPQVREIPLLVGVSRLALCLLSYVAPSAWSHFISQSVQLRTLPALTRDNVSMWTVICPCFFLTWCLRHEKAALLLTVGDTFPDGVDQRNTMEFVFRS